MGNCGECKYHDNFTGACGNGYSEYRGDFTDVTSTCTYFVAKRDVVASIDALTHEVHEMNLQLRKIVGRM